MKEKNEDLHLNNSIGEIYIPSYTYVLEEKINSVDGITNRNPVLYLKVEESTMSIDSITHAIHAEDRSFLLNAKRVIIEFLNQMDEDRLSRYKAVYNLRIEMPNGQYHLFQHHTIILYYDNIHQIQRTYNRNFDLGRAPVEMCRDIVMVNLDDESDVVLLDLNSLNKNELNLTKREKQLIEMIASGDTNAAIAKKLFLSIHTVKNHRKNILKKSNVKTTAELIARYKDGKNTML